MFIIIWNLKHKIQFKKLCFSIFLLVTVLSFFQTKKIALKTFIKTPILTYDYEFKDNKINYQFWNENGENSKEVSYIYKTLDSSSVQIIDNQLYYKEKQITNDNSNKKKAIVIDNKKVVFLSDANLGIGFYGIKQLDL
jgi:hypothetical protein